MYYSLLRSIRLASDEYGVQVDFEDRLTNLSAIPTGVFARYALIAPQPFAPSTVPGGAENPTMFIRVGKEKLGILVQDDVSRVRWRGSVNKNETDFQIGFLSAGQVSVIALDVGTSYSIRWRLYILPQQYDYFDFYNRVRSQWKSNFTIEGPFEFLYLGPNPNIPIQNPQELAAYLKRKRLRLVALVPYLDYDPGRFSGDVVPRGEYANRILTAIEGVKAVDPAIKCLGCIETDWVAIDPAVLAQNIGFSSINWTQKTYDDLVSSVVTRVGGPAGNAAGDWPLTPTETGTIDCAKLPWQDCVFRDVQGNLKMELYQRDSKWLSSLRVYPKGSGGAGNYQYRFLLENQIKFLLDDIGFDGFYIDEFSQSWNSPGNPFWTYFHSYTGWDGLSADIDPSTAKIVAPPNYIDMGLAGRAARQEICNYALTKKKDRCRQHLFHKRAGATPAG